ncbi:MAG TPA: galactokinase [bacterium]
MGAEHRVARVREEFQKRFSSAHIVRFFESPGQVNLLGDHMDYNGGFVLSCCIDRSVIAGIQPNDKALLRLYSINHDAACECPVESIANRSEQGWANRPLGIAWALGKKGIALSGFDLTFESDIPSENSLASPAAFETIAAMALAVSLHQSLDLNTLALVCAYAENEFLKVQRGITDQFAIAHGNKGKAVFLDCRSLKHELIAFEDPDVSLAICCPAVKNDLTDPVYNARRSECEEGVRQLINYVGFIRKLRDISVEQFETLKYHLPEKIMKRCSHVIYENIRVLQAQEFLRKKRFRELGKLMNESHRSLKNLYEVSTPELDFLTDTAGTIEGVYGSRMTGTGPGASVVTLLEKKCMVEFEKRITEKYREKFADSLNVFASGSADGVHEITS